jgi:hypothetical protein
VGEWEFCSQGGAARLNPRGRRRRTGVASGRRTVGALRDGASKVSFQYFKKPPSSGYSINCCTSLFLSIKALYLVRNKSPAPLCSAPGKIWEKNVRSGCLLPKIFGISQKEIVVFGPPFVPPRDSKAANGRGLCNRYCPQKKRMNVRTLYSAFARSPSSTITLFWGSLPLVKFFNNSSNVLFASFKQLEILLSKVTTRSGFLICTPSFWNSEPWFTYPKRFPGVPETFFIMSMSWFKVVWYMVLSRSILDIIEVNRQYCWIFRSTVIHRLTVPLL